MNDINVCEGVKYHYPTYEDLMKIGIATMVYDYLYHSRTYYRGQKAPDSAAKLKELFNSRFCESVIKNEYSPESIFSVYLALTMADNVDFEKIYTAALSDEPTPYRELTSIEAAIADYFKELNINKATGSYELEELFLSRFCKEDIEEGGPEDRFIIGTVKAIDYESLYNKLQERLKGLA